MTIDMHPSVAILIALVLAYVVLRLVSQHPPQS